MSITDKWHTVSINRESWINPKNTLKIDGKIIEGIRNVKIEYGLNEAYPIITIEFSVKKLNAQIKSSHINKTKEVKK